MVLARSEVTRGRRPRPARGTAVRLGLMALPLAFFALFFGYPVVAIVGRGLKDGGQWQLDRFGAVLG
ncbi:iron ABC transporter permease, partial [Streptomyces decoyicus]